MNMPLVLLNRRRRAGGFSPYVALFANDERGVFLDPSDTANLSWRRNLLTFTEQFDNAAWVKSGAGVAIAPTVTANAGVAPDGTTTADRIQFDCTNTGSSANRSSVTQGFTATTGVSYTSSIYIRAFDAGNIGRTVRITSDFIGTTVYTLTADWQRVVIGGTSSGTGSNLVIETRGTFTQQTADILIWGAQLEVGSTATTYQPITDLNTEVRANFPNATLYQDTAGTTPVTTPGQSVALALDKSRGLVLGSELVTNGDFSAGSTGWTVPAGWTITGGAAVGAATSASLFGGGFTPVAGRTYRVDFDAVSYTSGTLFITVGGNYSGNPTLSLAAMAPGRKTVYVVAGSTPSRGVEFYGGSIVATIDNISVRELPGNHATQATAGSRPRYALLPANGVRNMAGGSADVGNNAVWLTGTTQNGITMTKVASGFDVDGLPYVDVRYQGTSTSTNHDQIVPFSFAVQSGAAGQSATCSVIARVISGSVSNVLGLRARMSEETAPSTFIGIALGTPVTASTDTVTTATRTLSTGNQFRATLSLDFNTASTIDVTYRVKAIQVEIGSTRTAYQFNYSNVNIAQPPFAQVGALLFDGVDDFLQTPSVGFESYTWDGLARRNFALGSAQPSNDGFWPASSTQNGITMTRVASGFRNDGLPFVQVRYQGVTTDIFHNSVYTFANSRNAAVSGQVYTASAICRLVSGTLTGVTSTEVYVQELNSSAILLTQTASGVTLTSSDQTLSHTRTLNQATTAFAQGALNIAFSSVGATIDFTVEFAGFQFEQAATRSTWQGTGTDKMTVFAGVRKLSDAARAMVAELGNNTTGSFRIEAPGSSLNNFAVAFGGSAVVGTSSASSFSSPISSVISGAGDISGDIAVLRVNGTQVGSNPADQGTGNYRNDIIYIGRRGGTTLPFSGYLHSLIVRGAATDTATIQLVERWVNSRTGAY